MSESTNMIVRNAMAAVANTTGGALFKCPRCGATGNPYDGFCRTCGHLLGKDEMLWRANELIERELRKSTPHGIKGLAYVKGVGRIDLEVGKRGVGPGMDYGSGLVKLLQKHGRDVSKLGFTLALGRTYDAGVEGKLMRIHGDYVGVLGMRRTGASVISHYKDAGRAARYERF